MLTADIVINVDLGDVPAERTKGAGLENVMYDDIVLLTAKPQPFSSFTHPSLFLLSSYTHGTKAFSWREEPVLERKRLNFEVKPLDQQNKYAL